MHLIFLNRFFWPDHAATSQMLSDLAFSLAQAETGHEPIVLTSRLSYDDPGKLLPREENVDGVRILRVWTSRFGRRALIGRALDYITFYLSTAWMLARVARAGDIVVIKTDPPLLSLVAHPIARLKGARVVNWLQDIYPEVAEALGVVRGPLRVVSRVLKWSRNCSLRRADANVVLGQRMAERVTAIVGHRRSLAEIPNWADGSVIRPVPQGENSLRAAWGLTDAFVIAYSGNLGRAHEVATLIDSMAEIPELKPKSRIVWLFIGGGAQFDALQAEVARLGQRDVLFQPYQPRARLAESLSVADVHLISLQPALEGLIVPSKLYGILAAGRPAIFVGDAEGEVARVLAEVDGGVTVEIGDGSGLARHIVSWSTAHERTAKMGSNARIAFDTGYDKPHAIARWRILLGGLTGSKRV